VVILSHGIINYDSIIPVAHINSSHGNTQQHIASLQQNTHRQTHTHTRTHTRQNLSTGTPYWFQFEPGSLGAHDRILIHEVLILSLHLYPFHISISPCSPSLPLISPFVR
jgi:hypothetical protein